jgi:hypothetical protein
VPSGGDGELREAIRLWNDRGVAMEEPPALAPFDPWTLPECGPEYEVMMMRDDRGSGVFRHGPNWGALQFVPNGSKNPDLDALPFECIRAWRRVSK